MSPAGDLVLWEVLWRIREFRLLPLCVFCGWEGTGVDTLTDTATKDLIAASVHECSNADSALRHVVYVRSGGARGRPFAVTEGRRVSVTEFVRDDTPDRGVIGVGPLPGRKSPALYLRDEGLLRTVAYFRNDGDAAEFVAALRRLVEQ